MSFKSMLEHYWEKKGKGWQKPATPVKSSGVTPRGFSYSIFKSGTSEGACEVVEPAVKTKSRLVKAEE